MRPGPGSQLLDPPAEGQEVHPGWRSQAAAPHHGLSQVRALPAVCFSALTHHPCGPTWGVAAKKPRRALLAHFLPVFLHTLVQVSGVSGLMRSSSGVVAATCVSVVSAPGSVPSPSGRMEFPWRGQQIHVPLPAGWGLRDHCCCGRADWPLGRSAPGLAWSLRVLTWRHIL